MVPDNDSLRKEVCRAFSLVELVVVLAIFATIAAIGMPRYASAERRYRVDATARQIKLDLEYARTKARTSSTSQEIVFDVAGDRYVLTGLLDSSTGETYTVIVSDSPFWTRIVSVNLGGDSRLIYDGYGRPNAGGDIVVQTGDDVRTIRVDAGADKIKLLIGSGASAVLIK